MSNSRHISLLLVVALSWLPALADGVISFPRDRASTVAVVVRRLSDNTDLVSQNAHRAMLPASTMKCVTSAAAVTARLDTVKIRTRVFIRGTVDSSGTLLGDLILQGAGDPTMESGQFADARGFASAVARAVKAKGISRIDGDIVLDLSQFPDSGPVDRWEISDTHYGYGAGLYALNWRDNTSGSRAMADPPESLGEAVEQQLNSLGITVGWNGGTASAGQSEREDDAGGTGVVAEEILVWESPAGGRILDNLMKRSDNLFAEAMLRQLQPGKPRSAALARERELLSEIGVNLDIADIYDGSGLSRNNRITASTMADLLSAMASRGDDTERYVALFPRVGKEGTVKSLLSDTRLTGRLALKSGSMNGVHCYAGYYLDEQGKPTHAVVIMVNDFFCKRDAVRKGIEQFLLNQF